MWNIKVLAGEPKDDAAKERFKARLADIAARRGVSVDKLPKVTTWVEAIELDEGRL